MMKEDAFLVHANSFTASPDASLGCPRLRRTVWRKSIPTGRFYFQLISRMTRVRKWIVFRIHFPIAFTCARDDIGYFWYAEDVTERLGIIVVQVNMAVDELLLLLLRLMDLLILLHASTYPFDLRLMIDNHESLQSNRRIFRELSNGTDHRADSHLIGVMFLLRKLH